MPSPLHSFDPLPPSPRWAWFALLAFALLVRGVALWAQFASLDADPDGYRELGERLAATGAYARRFPYGGAHGGTDGGAPQSELIPTAYRPPLYPFALSLLAARGATPAWRIAAFHWVLGAATVLLVASLAREARCVRGMWLAAVLVALDPILLQQSTLVMTETLATFLATAALLALVRAGASGAATHAALAGGVLGAAALCRPAFLPLVPAGAALLALQQGSLRMRAARGAALLLAASVVLSGWVFRNVLEIGKPLASTTHGGYTLLLGNNEHFYAAMRSGRAAAWDARELQAELEVEVYAASRWRPGDPPPEVREDALLYRRAGIAMRADPGAAVQAALLRVTWLWSPLPHAAPHEAWPRTAARFAVGAWYCLIYAMAGWGAWKLGAQWQRLPWSAGLALCLATTAVHLAYWSNLRMRAPLMPFVCLLAGVAAEHMLRRAKHAVPADTSRVEPAGDALLARQSPER